MIVRILGEGQFDVASKHQGRLGELDEELAAAVDGTDEKGFSAALEQLLTEVRKVGRPVSPDHLGPSDLVLPATGSTREEVADVLSGKRAIPD